MSEPSGGKTTRLARVVPRTRWERVVLMAFTALMGVSMVALSLACGGLTFLMHLFDDPVRLAAGTGIAFAFGSPYLITILWLDRNEPEPAWLVLATLLWGGVTSTGVSIFFNDLFSTFAFLGTQNAAIAGQLTTSVSAPVVEELAKGSALIVLYLFFRKEFDSVLDGVIYGALLGLGFAVVENALYYQRPESMEELLQLVVLRSVLTGAGTHMCFTAMTGASVGLFRVLRSGVLRWALPFGGLGLAMGAHFAWNTFVGLFVAPFEAEMAQLFVGIPLAVLFLQVPFLLLVALVALLASAHESRILVAYLEAEEVLRDGELAALVPSRRRFAHLSAVLFREGPGAWWQQRRRFGLLAQLAFEKWHMDREADHGSDDAALHAVRVRDLRKVLGGDP